MTKINQIIFSLFCSFIVSFLFFGVLYAQEYLTDDFTVQKELPKLTYEEKTKDLTYEEKTELYQIQVIQELQQIRVELMKLNRK